MTDEVQEQVERVHAGVRGFAAEMRALGIHVGLGNPGCCVTCGEAWPCPSSAPEVVPMTGPAYQEAEEGR